MGTAQAAGFHYLKAGGLYGTANDQDLEAGFEVSLYSDGIGYWMTFGDPEVDGHRVKEWWIESHHYGPQLGEEPLAMSLGDEEDERTLPLWLEGFGFFRLGTDHTTRRNFVVDGSRHLALNAPGFFDVPASRFHFGPTAGLGWNLTWWDNWKGKTDYVINTGKVTAEAGVVAGAFFWDTVFAQTRVTGHYDLFGIHQTQLKAAAIAGVYFNKVGLPLGLEVKGEYDRGNDTVTTKLQQWWAARIALVYRDVPKDDDLDLEGVLEALREADATIPPPQEDAQPQGEPDEQD